MTKRSPKTTANCVFASNHSRGGRFHADFVSAYDFARRLKTLKSLTPYEYICKSWTKEPKHFRLGPIH